MSLHEDEHPFYGYDIIRQQEQEIVDGILAKYKGRKADDSLHKEIWNELQQAKYQGLLKMPFKVVFRRDESNLFPTYIEVILDTKV